MLLLEAIRLEYIGIGNRSPDRPIDVGRNPRMRASLCMFASLASRGSRPSHPRHTAIPPIER